MINIQDKVKLFSKIVYDKVQKENQDIVDQYNEKYGDLLNQKKQEYQQEAENIEKQSLKNIQAEETKILSKARMESKDMLLKKRQQLFDKTVDELVEYAKSYINDDIAYPVMLENKILEIVKKIENLDHVEFYMTTLDMNRLKVKLTKLDEFKNACFNIDDSIIGGFIVIDKDKNIKIDESILSMIDESKEIIGQKLFEILQ